MTEGNGWVMIACRDIVGMSVGECTVVFVGCRRVMMLGEERVMTGGSTRCMGITSRLCRVVVAG